jgi:hypothetical protein
MSKVYGMHMITPLPGVTEEEFEQFFTEEYYHLPKVEGWEFYLLKGDRGDREGKYLWLSEIESVETRERYVTASGLTAEGVKYVEQPAVKAVLEKWATIASPMGPIGIFTDYIVVGK